MIKSIVKDPIFLSQKSVPATPEDLPLARDLVDTFWPTGRAAWAWRPT